MNKAESIQIFEHFLQEMGFEPNQNVISEFHTIVGSDDGTIQCHVDDRLPNFCRIDRVFYNTGLSVETLGHLTSRITRYAGCVKAWNNADSVVLVFESAVTSARLQDRNMLHTILTLLEGTWQGAIGTNNFQAEESSQSAAAAFIADLERDLRNREEPPEL